MKILAALLAAFIVGAPGAFAGELRFVDEDIPGVVFAESTIQKYFPELEMLSTCQEELGMCEVTLQVELNNFIWASFNVSAPSAEPQVIGCVVEDLFEDGACFGPMSEAEAVAWREAYQDGNPVLFEEGEAGYETMLTHMLANRERVVASLD